MACLNRRTGSSPKAPSAPASPPPTPSALSASTVPTFSAWERSSTPTVSSWASSSPTPRRGSSSARSTAPASASAPTASGGRPAPASGVGSGVTAPKPSPAVRPRSATGSSANASPPSRRSSQRNSGKSKRTERRWTLQEKKDSPRVWTVPWLRALIRRYGYRTVRDRTGWRDPIEWNRVLHLEDPLQDPSAQAAIQTLTGSIPSAWAPIFQYERSVQQQRDRERRQRTLDRRHRGSAACSAAGRAASIAALKADGEASPRRHR